MSASLVGSEMCIRDRPCTSAQPDCCGPSCALDSTTPLSLLCADRGRSAVSYTHLTLPTICSV
eukprot:6557914-Alexandrium_andersonii.AAC.1